VNKKCGNEKERLLIGSRRTRGGSSGGGSRTNVIASRTPNIATYNTNSGPVILVNSYKGDNYFNDS
jgi:hypothetical protein